MKKELKLPTLKDFESTILCDLEDDYYEKLEKFKKFVSSILPEDYKVDIDGDLKYNSYSDTYGEYIEILKKNKRPFITNECDIHLKYYYDKKKPKNHTSILISIYCSPFYDRIYYFNGKYFVAEIRDEVDYNLDNSFIESYSRNNNLVIQIVEAFKFYMEGEDE